MWLIKWEIISHLIEISPPFTASYQSWIIPHNFYSFILSLVSVMWKSTLVWRWKTNGLIWRPRIGKCHCQCKSKSPLLWMLLKLSRNLGNQLSLLYYIILYYIILSNIIFLYYRFLYCEGAKYFSHWKRRYCMMIQVGVKTPRIPVRQYFCGVRWCFTVGQHSHVYKNQGNHVTSKLDLLGF